MFIRVLPLVILFPLAFGASSVVRGETKVTRFERFSDYRGRFVSAAIDPDTGKHYLATMVSLSGFDGQRIFALTNSTARKRIELAPGAGMYAVLSPLQIGNRVSVELLNIGIVAPSRRLVLTPPSTGFDEVTLGFQGKLILTGSSIVGGPVGRGQAELTFWGKDGKPRATHNLMRPYRTSLAADGSAVMLLGRDRAQAFDSDGTELWDPPLEGNYRSGVIGQDGKTAVLNPAPSRPPGRPLNSGAQEHRDIVIRKENGTTRRISFEKPVFHIRIAPDDSFAVIVIDGIRWFTVSLPDGDPVEGPALTLDDAWMITDLEILDRNIVVLGVLHGGPRNLIKKATVIAIDRHNSAVPLVEEELKIGVITGSLPTIEVTPGRNEFIAFTDLATIVVEVER